MVSCDKANLKLVISGKSQKVNGYEVILEDTVLFPEGGGQASAEIKNLHGMFC